MRDKREFRYVVDAEDRLVSANGEWFDFARENGAQLDPKKIIGRSLWDFICDAETKILYTLFLKNVRQSGQPKSVPYRCDSPDRRRFMEMTISKLPDDHVEFRSRIVREERRKKVDLIGFNAPRAEDLLVMCSWCKKIHLPNGEWAEAESAVETLKLFNPEPLPRITHGICDRCKAEMTGYSW